MVPIIVDAYTLDFAESRTRKHFVFFTMACYLRSLPSRKFRVGSVENIHGNVDYEDELQDYQRTICTTDQERLSAIVKFEKDVYEKKAQKRTRFSDIKRLDFIKRFRR